MIKTITRFLSVFFYGLLFWAKIALWYLGLSTFWKKWLADDKWSRDPGLARTFLQYSYHSENFYAAIFFLDMAMFWEPAIACKVPALLRSFKGNAILGKRAYRRYTLSRLKYILKHMQGDEA